MSQKAIVVEDSRAMRAILRRLLEEVGFEVAAAAGGQDAVHLLDEQPDASLALVEGHLLEPDGMEFIRAVRSRPAMDRMRILVLASDRDMDLLTEALQAGADGHMVKPFTPETLSEKLRALEPRPAAAAAPSEASRQIRVLVVDDAAVVRRVLTQIIEADPALTVAAAAANGEIALEYLDDIGADIVTLDVEMPVMDGLETMAHIRRRHPDLPVVMVSSLTHRGAAATLDALALGATDYVTKPANLGGPEEARAQLASELLPRLRELGRKAVARVAPVALPKPPTGRLLQPVDVVAIGVSTGGPEALASLLPSLSGNLSVPLLIVQHMPPMFTTLLAQRLSTRSPIKVVEAHAGQPLVPGQAYMAPGDFHMEVSRSGGTATVKLHQGPKENSCRPSVDVLFRSVAETYGSRALGVILTGMGQDGLLGSQALRGAEAAILAQDEASSVIWGMPGYVAKAGLADRILPLDSMGREIMRRVAVGRQAEP